MTVQSRIKARFAELAAEAGVRFSVTARKSNATEYTDHLFDGKIFYMTIGYVGEVRLGAHDIREAYAKVQRFIRETGLQLQMTSGGAFETTYNMQPRDIERVLTETEIDSDCLRWNNAAVLGIAKGIRAKKSFTELPVLADALEEAGCKNERFLDHCRANEPHGETCWVVEAIIGSSK